VGIAASQPETKGLPLGTSIEELGKTFRVMLSPGVFIGISSGVDIAWSPAFPPVPDMIPGLFEEKGKDRKLDIQCRPQVRAVFQPPVVLAREDGIPARSAGRAGYKGMVK
jgi:hypothetical protein